MEKLSKTITKIKHIYIYNTFNNKDYNLNYLDLFMYSKLQYTNL